MSHSDDFYFVKVVERGQLRFASSSAEPLFHFSKASGLNETFKEYLTFWEICFLAKSRVRRLI